MRHSLVASLCLIILLLSAQAPAGPTTGQLQQQIDELTAHVNRLRTLIEEPNDKTYFAGLASVSQFQDCQQNDERLVCEEKALILVDVLEGQQVYLEIDAVGYARLTIIKVPSENPLSSRDYQVNVKADCGPETFSFNVSPDHPFYASDYDSNYPGTILPVSCELITDWRIKILVEADSTLNVQQIRTVSFGSIDNAYIEPYTESTTETQLKVSVSNIGDFTANYIVTATGFGPFIEPVPAPPFCWTPS